MAKKRKIVVTAGPTREYLDPIRYITNESSGLLGFEIAKAAKRAGDDVVLICGNPDLGPIDGVVIEFIRTARDLERSLKKHLLGADALFMSSAVCDFAPSKKAGHKIKRAGKQQFSLEFTQNKDILKAVSTPRFKGNAVFVGFCIETKSVRAHAFKKLREKRLDYIVASRYTEKRSPFGKAAMDPLIIDAGGGVVELKNISKRRLAGRLIRLVHKSIDKK